MTNENIYQILKDFLKIHPKDVFEYYGFAEKYCPAPFKCIDCDEKTLCVDTAKIEEEQINIANILNKWKDEKSIEVEDALLINNKLLKVSPSLVFVKDKSDVLGETRKFLSIPVLSKKSSKIFKIIVKNMGSYILDCRGRKCFYIHKFTKKEKSRIDSTKDMHYLLKSISELLGCRLRDIKISGIPLADYESSLKNRKICVVPTFSSNNPIELCYLYLRQIILINQSVSLCQNCLEIYFPKRANKKYCDSKTCQKSRLSIRQKKFQRRHR